MTDKTYCETNNDSASSQGSEENLAEVWPVLVTGFMLSSKSFRLWKENHPDFLAEICREIRADFADFLTKPPLLYSILAPRSAIHEATRGIEECTSSHGC